MAKINNLLILLTVIFISTSITTAVPPPPPPATETTLNHTSLAIAAVLNTLGFEQLSSVAAKSLSTTVVPLTIFAPSDNSLLTCPSCSAALLLQEHTIPGLYTFPHLLSLSFGTKIQTLSPNLRCLTVTSTGAANGTVFINGAQVTRPNLFHNKHVMIHGVQGYLSHLSPLSCNVEYITSLSFPSIPLSSTPFFIMRLMLKDALVRLRLSGYGVVALALREKYNNLIELRAATIFALDDESIFAAGGHSYLQDLGFHIVPNKRLTAAHLVGMEAETVVPTMKVGEKLVVTTAGGGGLARPMRINYVKVRNLDLMYNSRVVVHGLASPFRHVRRNLTDVDDLKENGWSGFEKTMGPTGMTVVEDDDED